MDLFWKAIAAGLIAVILSLSLHQTGRDISLVLTLAVCCMVVAAAASYLEPVVDVFHKLQSWGQLDWDMLSIMLKALGVGLVAEIACLICADAGNAALGKALQILATAVILWISLPLLTRLMDLVTEILGEV